MISLNSGLQALIPDSCYAQAASPNAACAYLETKSAFRLCDVIDITVASNSSSKAL